MHQFDFKGYSETLLPSSLRKPPMQASSSRCGARGCVEFTSRLHVETAWRTATFAFDKKRGQDLAVLA